MKNKKILSILGCAAIAGSLVPSATFAQTSQTAKIKVSAPEFISLSISANEMVFDSGIKGLMTDTIVLTGDTNSPAGYNISFNVDNPYSGLRHTVSSAIDDIPTITADVAAEEFPSLGWGYSLDTEIFKEAPLTSTNIFSSSTNGRYNHDFTTGVRIADAIVAGTYENQLLFTIIANGVSSDFGGIAYLQDMTPDICAATPDGAEAQLVDRRDNKKYWVTKFDNGECWMTQNLDFEATIGTVLTTDDTDVLSNRTLQTEGYIDRGEYYYQDGHKRISTAGLAEDSVNWHYYAGSDYNHVIAAAENPDVINNNLDSENGDYRTKESICPKGWKLPESRPYNGVGENRTGQNIGILTYTVYNGDQYNDSEETQPEIAKSYWTNNSYGGRGTFTETVSEKYGPWIQYNSYGYAAIRCVAHQ